MSPALSIGLPRMHKEAGERRDFLPELVGQLEALGAALFLEQGLGSGMGLSEASYLEAAPRAKVVSNAEAFQQDLVLVLRCPELDELPRLRPGATLISMLHFPTRPRRIRTLKKLGVNGIGMDSITDDAGRRLVENMKAVAWNGVEAAFDALERLRGPLDRWPQGPVAATVLGAGQVGKHAVEAATKYGDRARASRLDQNGGPGVEVTVLGRSLTSNERYLRQRLSRTDVLIDASQRDDATRPLIPNAWLADLPQQAVVCDLVVDPYVTVVTPPTVRSIEGIPMGNLDKLFFQPGDADWNATIPEGIPTQQRRPTVSCYSWPGVHPEACMAVYGQQLLPLLECLVKKGGPAGLSAGGTEHERALLRASLASWAARLGE